MKQNLKVRRNDKDVKLRNRENEVLFIDARRLGDAGKNEEGFVNLTQEDKELIQKTLFAWQSPEWKDTYKDIPEFCYSATKEEIAKNGYSLVPSKYIEFIDHDLDIDFEKEMARIQKEMKLLLDDEKQSQKELEEAFRGIGYEIK